MPDYQKGKIYGIYHNDNIIYIGSTSQSHLHKRWNCHKTRSKQLENYPYDIYKYMNEYDINEFKLLLVENFPCNNKDELRKREKEIMIEHKNNGIELKNKFSPLTTIEEKKEYMKEYYDNYRNGEKREELLEKKREYRHNNKEKLKEQNKKYYEKNKDIIAIKDKEKYEKNKSIINEKRKERVLCECGTEYRKTDRARHNKSKTHQDFILVNNP